MNLSSYIFLTIQFELLFYIIEIDDIMMIFVYVFQKEAHFEWVAEYEKTIKELATEVFDNLGADQEITLNIAVNRLGEFLETMKNNLDGLTKLVLNL